MTIYQKASFDVTQYIATICYSFLSQAKSTIILCIFGSNICFGGKLLLFWCLITELNFATHNVHWASTGICFNGVLQIIFRQNSYKNKGQKFKTIKVGEKPFFENCIKVKLKKYPPPKQNKATSPADTDLIHPILVFSTSKKLM